MQAFASMHKTERCRRVSELIRRELSTLIAREVDDQRVRMVSIVAVEVSADLKQANVYVSCVDSSVSPKEVEKILNHASKYLRYLLGQQVHLRVTPALRFRYDDSIRQGIEMTLLIDSLKHKHGTS